MAEINSIEYYKCPKDKCGKIFEDFEECRHHIKIHWLKKVRIKKPLRPANLPRIDTRMTCICHLCNCEFKGTAEFEKHQMKQHLPAEFESNNVVNFLFE